MKNLLPAIIALLLLCACGEKSKKFEEEPEVRTVPVVLRDETKATPKNNPKIEKALTKATVVTVTVFRTESPNKTSSGSQLISLPVHPLRERCTTNDLALVGGVSVPVTDFYQVFAQPSLDAMPNYLRRTFNDERGDFINQLINAKVFEYAAAHEDFSSVKGYAEAVEDAVHKVNIEYFYNRYVNPKVAVTEEDIKKYYDTHPDEFKKPAQYRAAHILVQVSPTAYRAEVSNAFNRASELRRRALEGEDFGQLAASYSDCPSKVRGGDLDFFVKGQTHPAFERAVERLQKGEISPVVETSQGYHVIKLLDRIPERIRSLEETKEEIRGQLELIKASEAYQEVLNALTNKYKVIRNENLIRRLVEQY